MTKQPITNLNNHFEKILKYWSVIETLNPQGPSKITTDEYVRNYTVKADADSLPWNHTHEHQTVSVTERTKWVYTLYAGELSLTDSYATIVNAFQEFPSQNNNKSKETFSLFSVCVDHFGRLMSDSILISSYAWALGKIEESGKESYKDLDAFTDEEEHIQRDLKDFLNATFSANSMISSETNAQRKLSPEILEPVTPDQLFTLYNFLCDKLKLSRLKEDRTIMIRASMFSDESGAPDTSGLLNSFFLNDLQQLQEESKANNLSEAAMQYLAASIDTNTRIDIRQTSAAFMDVFTPDHYPRGCWPNTGNHPLVFSQQFAVNSFFKECLSKDGLFSVNGPPGTGKTTLLRDVIANVIVERACCLAQLETPSGAFKRSTIKKADGKESDIYELDSALHGFEIVVTSSNNAAVENITLEIPGIDAVDPSTLGNCDYFRPWAERLLKDKAWGMVAGRLGNKSNRDTFIKDFWLDLEVQDDQYINLSKAILDKKDDGKGFDGFLKAHSATIFGATADNDESTTSENQTKSWKDSVADFNQALATEHVFCKARQAVFEIYQKMIVLRSEYITLKRAMLQNPENEHNETTKRLSEIQAAIITFKETIPKDFDHTLVPHFIKQNNVDIDAQELSSPWMDQDWYQARVNVFQAALNLHKKFVLSNARIFRWNLRQFMLMLAGDSGFGEDVKHLWATLFMLIPVISTTFASFSRLFSDMGKASLGFVLIDEAGQTLPQAAIGSLWRAKRALLVGDPMQLEPVIALDERIQMTIAYFADIEKKWIPAFNSAQELADRVGRFGTDVDDTWVGVPLRVHRRCDEIMFKISNAMAYDNMMVFGTPQRDTLELPPSQWFHVDSSYSKGNWIEEEGQALEGILTSLEKAKVDMKDVFLISPFTDVIYNTRGVRKRYGIKSGTIHSVQGKENQIVILVLGGKPQVVGSRVWATRKPNLLNVAVTRAKRRLYVIGNKRLWSKLPNARIMAQMLHDLKD